MRAAWMAALGFLAVAGCGADRAGSAGGTGQGTARVRNQPPAYCSDNSMQPECPAIDIVQCANGQEPVIDFDSGCCPHYSCQNECPAGAVALGCNGWPAPLCPPGTNLWIGSDEQCCALYRCMPNGSGGGGGGTGGWAGGGGGGGGTMCDPRAAIACPASLPYCGPGVQPVPVGEDEKCCPIWQCPCDVPPPGPGPGPDPTPVPDRCWGAWVDQAGNCRAPNDGMYPPECCIPTTDPSGPPSDGGVAPDPTFPDGGMSGSGSAPGFPGGPVPPGGGAGGGMGGYCGCTYPTCGPNEVLSCYGQNICGYPCVCEPIAPPPSGECTSDAECGPNGKCDTSLCLPSPGCMDPSGACPAVCYGKCAYDGQTGCQADSECGRGLQCRLHCWDDQNSMSGGCAGECVPEDPMGCRVSTTGGAPNTPVDCPPPAACPPGTASVPVGFDPASCCTKFDCQQTCDAGMGRTCAAPTCDNPIVSGIGPDCCPVFCCGSDCVTTGGGSGGGSTGGGVPTPGG